jgi:hypothetical protein
VSDVLWFIAGGLTAYLVLAVFIICVGKGW